MKCQVCHTDIPDKSIVCPFCGKDCILVPDYNPLDDILEQEMKNQFLLEDEIETDVYATKLFQDTVADITSEDSVFTDDLSARKTTVISKQSSHQTEKQKTQNTKAKRHFVKKKNKKHGFKLLLLFLILVSIGVFLFLSYTFQIKMGHLSYKYKRNIIAEGFFDRAQKIDPGRSDAYIGIANIYESEGKDVEKYLNKCIKKHGDSIELYQALIDYYEKNDELKKIDILFDYCENTEILDFFSDYVVDEPVFSLDAGEYDSIQQISLSGNGTIYYTVDGTDASIYSQVYSEPIELQEGNTRISAIAVSEKGVESDVVSQEYKIHLPHISAPIVKPSTGQYTVKQEITIEVPEGFYAYYTIDGGVPSVDAKKYSGPILMPDKSITFSAILVDEEGRESDISRRYYEIIDK